MFEEFKTLTTKVWEAQKAVVDAVKDHQQTMSDAVKSSGDEHSSVESIAGEDLCTELSNGTCYLFYVVIFS